jgi:hypothetical protein
LIVPLKANRCVRLLKYADASGSGFAIAATTRWYLPPFWIAAILGTRRSRLRFGRGRILSASGWLIGVRGGNRL